MWNFENIRVYLHITDNRIASMKRYAIFVCFWLLNTSEHTSVFSWANEKEIIANSNTTLSILILKSLGQHRSIISLHNHRENHSLVMVTANTEFQKTTATHCRRLKTVGEDSESLPKTLSAANKHVPIKKTQHILFGWNKTLIQYYFNSYIHSYWIFKFESSLDKDLVCHPDWIY